MREDNNNFRRKRFSKPGNQNNPEKSRSDRSDSYKAQPDNDEVRLNRYIANSGICSRRDADKLIEEGQVSVNGVVVTEMGARVKPGDIVKLKNKVLQRQNYVYVLLNKPKDFITTMEDPQNRRTVMDLVARACPERIFPVGRLDRNTTGLLLLTNDGALAERLTHPSKRVQKIYQVDLDKPITGEDFEKIKTGVTLEDGPVDVDDVAVLSKDRKILGIEIHEGRNRIIRRLFEHLGYNVVKLDRVMYAGLTKKDLPRGKWKFLSKQEIINLKHLNK